MSRLRPFQTTIKNEVFAAWAQGQRNVLVKSPTGSGKTVIVADVVRTVDKASAVIAHRSELVSQISLALAREGVRHRIVGPDSLRRNCVALHMERLGRSMYDAGGRVGVCGVDTLVNRDVAADPWFRQVGLWVQDEAHHVLRENKWGAAAEMFPNAQGLGVSATPARADGKGLGRHADGLFDALVYGPEMRTLIDSGYMTDYRIFAPPSDVDYSEVKVTASGDLSPAKLRAAVHASDSIVGDVVSHYLKIAKGKLGVTFAVDVESAKEIAAAFKAAGVPAEVVTAKTPDLLRAQILRRFENRQVLQLVNVDLFGEGFDLPAIEVVSMVRKTESWPLFVQQFGRALRLMISPELISVWDTFTDEQRRHHIATSGKPVALIIDHVGNVIRHGLPDAPRLDTLDARERRHSGPSDAMPLRVCANPNADGAGTPCASVYQRFLKVCPFCNFYPEPPARNLPEFVDGDLFELDPETLAAMRGKAAVIDGPARIPGHLNLIAAAGVRKQHEARYSAQQQLRNLIALWSGWQLSLGRDDSQSYRIFYHTFGIDVLSAQALGRPEAENLAAKIQQLLDKNQVVPL
jgi:DNA repair protein RadD